MNNDIGKLSSLKKLATGNLSLFLFANALYSLSTGLINILAPFILDTKVYEDFIYVFHNIMMLTSIFAVGLVPTMLRFYKYDKENNITDNRRVGLYGLTYKENVDDFCESPTLQLLEAQERHLARPLKCYDPFLENHKIAENQYPDFDESLKDIDMVVIMVKHDHIKQNWDKLRGKVIMDSFNICPLEGTYHI